MKQIKIIWIALLFVGSSFSQESRQFIFEIDSLHLDGTTYFPLRPNFTFEPIPSPNPNSSGVCGKKERLVRGIENGRLPEMHTSKCPELSRK